MADGLFPFSRRGRYARQAAALGDFSHLDELGYDTDAARGTLYAYDGDGGSYSVGSYRGQFFLAYAPAGSSMTGGDGSTWVKNADGSVTITTKGGRTYRYGADDGADGVMYRPENKKRTEQDGGLYHWAAEGVGPYDGTPNGGHRPSRTSGHTAGPRTGAPAVKDVGP